MGLADAIPGKLKGAFTKKPKPSARRYGSPTPSTYDNVKL